MAKKKVKSLELAKNKSRSSQDFSIWERNWKKKKKKERKKKRKDGGGLASTKNSLVGQLEAKLEIRGFGVW